MLVKPLALVFSVTSILFAATAPALAQSDAPTEACIQVVSTATASQLTMGYTNRCSACAEFVPMLRKSDNTWQTGLNWTALSKKTMAVMQLMPGESDQAGWTWQIGSFTGHATQVRACTIAGGHRQPAPGQVSGGGCGSSCRESSAKQPLVSRSEGNRDYRSSTAPIRGEAALARDIYNEITANNNCAAVTQLLEIASSDQYHVYWPHFYRMASAAQNECAFTLVRKYMARSKQTFSDWDQATFHAAGLTTARQPNLPLSNGAAASIQSWINRWLRDGLDKNRLFLAAARDCGNSNHRAREAVAYLAKYKGADLEFGNNDDELFVERTQTPGSLILANCPDVPLVAPKPIPAGKAPSDLAARRRMLCTAELQAMDACGSPSFRPDVKVQPLPPGSVQTNLGRTR
jgi:hypothetical protein